MYSLLLLNGSQVLYNILCENHSDNVTTMLQGPHCHCKCNLIPQTMNFTVHMYMDNSDFTKIKEQILLNLRFCITHYVLCSNVHFNILHPPPLFCYPNPLMFIWDLSSWRPWGPSIDPCGTPPKPCIYPGMKMTWPGNLSIPDSIVA